ncbi:hypothetical protein PRUPE_1G412600 [Prunus persica]|uniref:Uncharacterized protein n=1 Tax=Prunus persica TaxID=3760 RepID=A0A251RBX0_PRUPE|nr:hypothetical protein PRUPE_1G412600 [Prunus persica]
MDQKEEECWDLERQIMPKNLALLGNLKQLEFTCSQVNVLECSDLLWGFSLPQGFSS